MATSTLIQSSQNPKVQLVRALMNQNKARQKHQAFVAEGVRLLEDGLKSEMPVKFILQKENPSPRAQAFLSTVDSEQCEILVVEDQLFDSLSGTEHSQGVLAVFEMKAFDLPDAPTFIVIPDQLSDPGNLGTILRSAEAAGAQAVLCSRILKPIFSFLKSLVTLNPLSSKFFSTFLAKSPCFSLIFITTACVGANHAGNAPS